MFWFLMLSRNRREFSRDKHTDAAARAAKRYSAPPMVLDAENATDAGVHFSSSLPAGGVVSSMLPSYDA